MAVAPTVKTIQPGVAGKLNKLAGVSTVITFTTAEWTAQADSVLQGGVLLFNTETGKMYISKTGVALKNLSPIIDNVLTDFEKATLVASLDSVNEEYTHGANGVVVLDDDAKVFEQDIRMLDAFDDQGDPTTDPDQADRYQINQDYFGWLFDGNDSRQDALDGGAKIKLELLPDSVRAGVTYVADIAARDAIVDGSEASKGLVFVVNAAAVWEDGKTPVRGTEMEHLDDLVSGDPMVEKGSAMYTMVWADKADHSATFADDAKDPYGQSLKDKSFYWLKIGEVESLDINVDDLKPTYDAVAEAGAVMYDQAVLLRSQSLADYVALDNELTTAEAGTDYKAPGTVLVAGA